MTYTLEVSAPAEADLADAMAWYARIRPVLAADFLLCVEEALDRIADNPHAFPAVLPAVRRAVIHRFPYGIAYRIKHRQIFVEAIFPDRDDPLALRRRVL